MPLYKIKKTNIDRKGLGLYAAKNIKKGTKIINYIGKIITKKQTEISKKYDNTKPIYLFNLNNRYDLDGDYSFNTARLINHSCSNNCEYDGKGLKLWVTAIRDIKKGEELTCDYGFGYDEDYKQFPCNCGSKNCCGYIVRAESRWRINKKFSLGYQKNNVINK
jgi:SET domain-containing protein|tara:strand:- start:899 stop:1387 length:489 start_codon:yes stop_codon:yes gene_type:complete